MIAPLAFDLGESFRTAMSEIWGHKLRTVLTLLGIFLGTMAIVVMSSFLDGIVITVWRSSSISRTSWPAAAPGRTPCGPPSRTGRCRTAGSPAPSWSAPA